MWIADKNIHSRRIGTFEGNPRQRVQVFFRMASLLVCNGRIDNDQFSGLKPGGKRVVNTGRAVDIAFCAGMGPAGISFRGEIFEETREAGMKERQP